MNSLTNNEPFINMENPNSQLDPQNEIHSLAHILPEEYHHWLDYVASKEEERE